MSQRVYILLPVHNRREITQQFIVCLKTQTYSNFHLILIDDGSTDGTENMVHASIPSADLTVIKGNGNWWWAGSLQQGINWLKRASPAPSDVVLIINDDVIFYEDFIEQGVNVLQEKVGALLLARTLDESCGTTIETGVNADFKTLQFVPATSPEFINCLSTRGLFLKWDVLEQIGDFHPILLPHYASDYEFTMRAGRKGFSLRTDARVYLLPDSTATGVRKIAEGKNFQEVIKILFAKKSVMNPVYWSSFILFTSPIKWIPKNLLIVWARAGRNVLKSLRR